MANQHTKKNEIRLYTLQNKQEFKSLKEAEEYVKEIKKYYQNSGRILHIKYSTGTERYDKL